MSRAVLTRVAYEEAGPAAAPCAGTVLRLMLSQFRSYAQLQLETDARPVVLVGDNGAGKTNILEALSFLAPGRGLRGATLSAVAHRAPGAGEDALRPWAVATRLQGGDALVDLGTGQAPDGGERRVARVDGASESLGVLSRHVRVLWLTPAMDRLFVEAASGRRKFIDRLTLSLHPGHAVHAGAYERAMRERNRLLRDGPRDPAWLAALEAEMAEHGVAIAAARAETVEALSASIGVAGGDTFPAAQVALDGALERAANEGRARPADFAAELARGRGRDEAAGRTLAGPHTSDLVVTHAATGRAAAECSTGEQKALLIGLILAQARLVAAQAPGTGPLLLLDEVAAHLDERRRVGLFDALSALGVQAWLTGTDRAVFAPWGARAQTFLVAGGTARPA